MAERVVVALGGNALIRAGQRGTLDEQAANLDQSLEVVVELIRRGHPVVITHGNGPQVGHILLRVEAARGSAYDVPLDVCVAQSQGEIGYIIQQRLHNLLARNGISRQVVAVVTRTLVDADDPRLRAPTKPVGPFYRAEEAAALQERGVHMTEDAHRNYRRVVPSPLPVRIVEMESIVRLVESGTIVVAAGGGGIPVCEAADGALVGIEAVVDKDLTGSVLATGLNADRIVDLTAVECVMLWFGTPAERGLARLTVTEARAYLADGQFAPGSMGPKIEAAIHFLEHGGREFIVTTPEQAIAALNGGAGTHIER